MTMTVRAGLSALALSCALAPFTFATAHAEDADSQNPTIIVTATNAARDAEERAAKTPGGTDVVTYADYADKTVISLRDALAFSPGVYLQPRYGQEVRISIRGSGISRGFHMRGLTLLQDGVPINLADDNGDFQELDPVFLQHIEVYRGANALRYGSGTLGGAVNGVTPTGLTSPGLYLRGDAGSFETFRALATYGASDSVGDVWAGVSAETSNGDRGHAQRQALRFGLFGNVKTLDHPIFQVIDQESFDRGFFGRYDYAGNVFEATLGGELRYGTTDSRRFVNVGGEPGALTYDADLEARTANIYGELRVKPLAGLSLIAGGVWADGFREQDADLGSIDARAEYDAFSPKFGILYEPAEGIQLFANVSRSAEFPGFGEIIQTVSNAPVFVADLSEQRAWTYEIGTRGTLGRVSWDLALYRADIDGELLQFTVGPDIPASTFNADRTRHDGIEAALRFDAADWLRLTGVYTFSDFRFVDDRSYGDNRLPVVPRHVLRGEARFDFGRVHVAPTVEWVPEGAFADYLNNVQVPPYALLSLTAGASITDRLDLFLDARNITDNAKIGDISAVVDATTLSFGAPQRIYYPVERRGVFGGVRARF